ncbi:MAG: fluoride efflux transporter CrcB [Leptolyngbyaceae cyanobacterium bins.302]|nr:fluoride efflux transporter CrcB [Leptolyngbyaceae cyanobacterium bins.302]
MSWQTPIFISLGAIPGALSRYYVSIYLAQWLGGQFPFGTLFVNVTGAFVIGLFTTYLLDRAIAAPDLRLLVSVGFLGSYTTFSTYTLDAANLWRVNGWVGVGYWLGSPVLGILGLQLGGLLAKNLP